jgi:hypothetical protein
VASVYADSFSYRTDVGAPTLLTGLVNCYFLLVHDFNIDVIVNVCLARIIRNKTNRKALPVAGRHFLVIFNLAGLGQVVENPIVVVGLVNGHGGRVGYYRCENWRCCHNSIHTSCLLILAPEIGYTDLLALHVFSHEQIEGRALDAITGQ